jgi:hypothetical protein
MPLRAAGRHDQPVGDGALAFEVDEDDVLGLVVVEPGEDQVLDGGVPTLVRGGAGVGRGLMRRTGRGFAVQRGSSFDVLAGTTLAQAGAAVRRRLDRLRRQSGAGVPEAPSRTGN